MPSLNTLAYLRYGRVVGGKVLRTLLFITIHYYSLLFIIGLASYCRRTEGRDSIEQGSTSPLGKANTV